MRRALSVVMAAAVFAASAPAFAEGGSAGGAPAGGIEAPGGLYDKGPQERSPALTLWAFLPYTFGVGVGGRFSLPVLKDGFIPELNDSVEIEFGADVAFGGGYLGYSSIGLWIPVEGTWTFHFTPALSAYAKVGVGYNLYISNYTGIGALVNTVFPEFTLGGSYKFSDRLAFRLELGYPGVKAGISFAF